MPHFQPHPDRASVQAASAPVPKDSTMTQGQDLQTRLDDLNRIFDLPNNHLTTVGFWRNALVYMQ